MSGQGSPEQCLDRSALRLQTAVCKQFLSAYLQSGFSVCERSLVSIKLLICFMKGIYVTPGQVYTITVLHSLGPERCHIFA